MIKVQDLEREKKKNEGEREGGVGEGGSLAALCILSGGVSQAEALHLSHRVLVATTDAEDSSHQHVFIYFLGGGSCLQKRGFIRSHFECS